MSGVKNEFPTGGVLGLNLGQVLDGRFEIGNLIGYGGQGVVLNVRHLEWQRNLALKLPLPDVIRTPVHRDRYLQEAETWIKLGAHPNIVRCWFVHKVSGLPGLFLDLVSGGSVDDQIKNGEIGPGSWGKILRTLIQVTEGLTHSHSMGVVHRDVKPENLLVSNRGDIVLTDFGLVKPIDEESDLDARAADLGLPEDSSVTAQGQFVGTPRYGAPEQWSKDLEIGPYTDIYALGILFYELICGRRPFDSPEENADPLELIRRHLYTEPEDPRNFHPDIPEAFVKLALSCIAKDPGDRPQTAVQMLELLTEQLPLFGEAPHQRPKPISREESADLLNNTAVSLYSLGKHEESREFLQRGLMVEAGHPQCLYNMVQLERHQFKIDAQESIRRLDQANANYELALLCLEEGLGERARDILAALPPDTKTGTVHRIEGDSLMYSGNFQAARNAYRLAKGQMPADQPTAIRLAMAENGQTTHGHKILFPSAKSVFSKPGSEQNPTYSLYSDYKQAILEISSESLDVLPIKNSSSTTSSPRSETASAVQLAWNCSEKLLCQDDTHFELWSLADLSLQKRVQGRIIAVNKKLNRIFCQRSTELYLADENLALKNIDLPGGLRSNLPFRASFTADEMGLCVLTPEGAFGHINESFQLVTSLWPEKIPEVHRIVQFQTTSNGKMLILNQEGQLRFLDTNQRTEIFSLDLKFRPTEFQLDAQEQHIVLSNEDEVQILGLDGDLIFASSGPSVMDPRRENIVIWKDEVLSLYRVSPFHRLRSWREKIDQPRVLQIDNQGRRLMTITQDGERKIWELDEPNRVFENHLLLSLGVPYEKLIDSFQAYSALIEQAERLYQKKRYFLANWTVLNARAEPGFYQNKKALSIHWKCCKKLLPQDLENLWERLYSPNIVSSSLSQDHKTLLLAESRMWFLRDFGDRSGLVRFAKLTASPILSNRYVTMKSKDPYVVIIYKDGTASKNNVTDGSVIRDLDLKMGPLRSVVSSKDSILLISERYGLAYFDPVAFKVRSIQEFEPVIVSAAFPLLNQKAVIILPDQGPAIVDLKSGKLNPGLPLEGGDQHGDLSCAGELDKEGLFYWGFFNGTLLLSDRKSGEVVFSVNHQKEPITGFSINISMNLGITVTSKGVLNLFRLSDGTIMESFKAHTDSITSVKLTDNSRYLATRTPNGESRFWELSWILSDKSGHPDIEWLPKGNFPAIGKIFRRFKDRFA